jgi:lipoprotein-anchoring transpeptidase ErfK/SrfK
VKATGQLSPKELQLLRVGQPIKPRSLEFYHIEVDVSRQVLFLIERDGVVRWILPISVGNGKPFRFKGHTETGRTPLGTFQVDRKIDGWRDSPLGSMYYPSYIYRGIAIHGSLIFADAPSTHGCISVPAEAAVPLSKLMPIGTVVMVYQ